MAEPTFLALFLFPEEDRDPFSIRLPVISDRPAEMLRASTTFEGVRAVDVFRLADASSWPEAAAYLYQETVPGTVRDDASVEQVLTPDD
ncbi:hypothetical protein [Leifsonia shinshuensis]|uniref:hypothetical protein n=1 Tax=Leifsonia TaxID=110932 RepID=UPI00285E68F9|nr:hypothetical protein [Leifsonia shinshuensis]MDR6971558.1 hypothetical protein [Leifsonia shinshuensis]